MNGLEGFLESSVRTATPLLFAALGELIVERAGIINIGLEGFIIAGAFGALVGSEAGPAAAMALAIFAAVSLSFVFHFLVDRVGADQIVTGTAITLLGLGITGVLYRDIYGVRGAGLSIASLEPVSIPLLSSLPLIGGAVFNQPLTTYALYALLPACWWWMSHTHSGLALRAIGESPLAARSAGVAVERYRLGAVVAGGALAGISGATLVVAQVGTFAEGMSAGRGFIAIAIVVLGRWTTPGVATAGLLFGAATALQYHVQALGLAIPYQLVLALPYVLTLAALSGFAGRVRGPASLGKPLVESFNS